MNPVRPARTLNYIPQNDPFRNTVKHLIRNREGYMSEFKQFGQDHYDRIREVGFVELGSVKNTETYKATKFADDYYATLYGYADWIYQRIRGFIAHI